MVLEIVSVLVLGLMCGSELNVAVFGHPILKRQPLETHIRMLSSMAQLFGRVMPFWMGGSALLNLLLLFPFAHLGKPAWSLAAIALGVQVCSVLFSLLAPVPINNRITKWTLATLPHDWRAQEDRWDLYHWLRTCALVVAFALLIWMVRLG